MAASTQQCVFVAWMPYFTAAYPSGKPKHIAIGKARLLPDSDASWKKITGSPRPTFLRIHRDFPSFRPKGSPKPGLPVKGTLIHSHDPKWLEKHLDSVTAVVFLLACAERQALPAECFTTYPFHLKPRSSVPDDEMVGYYTKHAHMIESPRALRLTPPLPVRGTRPKRSVEAKAPWAKQLVKLMDTSPEHRLVVAVRQFFRTQFSDMFTSPPDQDLALHCSAIEAAIGMPKMKDISESFARCLAAHFGNEPGFKSFFWGLHKARSIFIHGVAAPEAGPPSSGSDPLSVFRRIEPLTSLHIMRLVTEEVICHALSPRSSGRRRPQSDPRMILRKVLYSDELWRDLRRILTRNGAKDSLMAMQDNEFESIAELASSLRHGFSWLCVKEPHDAVTVFKAIKTCALALSSLTPRTGDYHKEADRIGRLAHNRDSEGIEGWVTDDPWQTAWPSRRDRVGTLQAIVRALARRFDRYGVVPD